MSETQPNQIGRLGPLFAGIWLFFLLDPLFAAWAHRDQASGLVGIIGTLAFGTTYMSLWVRMRADRARLVAEPPLAFTAPYLGALVLLSVVMVASVGEKGLASVVYVAVAAVMVFPFRIAAPVVVTLVVGSLALSAVEDWESQVGTAFGVMAASVAVFGLRAVMRRNIDLIRAHEENAGLAVENERTRFARDLHDILGHSLTVITVKAELAQRLFDVDQDRARVELADLERLSRDALADVRRAVEGYRDLTLPGEIVRARTALEAAQITADLPNSTDAVPSDLRELFAWTVREGITNVIRHSDASHCQVVLTASSAEVRDDGRGAVDLAPDAGFTGLRERAARVGAAVVTRTLEPGFSLTVERAL
jgi:two-component system sensor histidine kinase DesK